MVNKIKTSEQIICEIKQTLKNTNGGDDSKVELENESMIKLEDQFSHLSKNSKDEDNVRIQKLKN